MGSAQKQKAKKAKPTAVVLLWGLDRGTPKGDAVRAILKELGVVAKTVLPEHLGDSAGAALGLVGMRPALMPYAGPVPECEFMLLANFSEPLLLDFLLRSRQAGAQVGYKAVLTKTNKDWPVVNLINEVAQEHEAMRAQAATPAPTPTQPSQA